MLMHGIKIMTALQNLVLYVALTMAIIMHFIAYISNNYIAIAIAVSLVVCSYNVDIFIYKDAR